MMGNNRVPINFRIRAALFVCAITLACVGDVFAQMRPIYDTGQLGLNRILKRLETTASVMMIGAHPDDEDSALLAYLARGENARTAYLSLTRGDGGQNIVGGELGEALGVIRTEELLQARVLDGAEQYFTRAYDYGFSKTLAEARSKWDEKIIVCDAVTAIRHFKPLVVISRFSGTPRDGHGQHQYAGYISPLAVKAAGDNTQCKASGAPWSVQKFYFEQNSREAPGVLKINTGRYDAMLGRSYFEVAMEGRSKHASQGEGRIEFRGDQFSYLLRGDADSQSKTGETGIFDGLDIRTNGAPSSLAQRLPMLAELTRIYAEAIAGRDRERSELAAQAIMLAAGIQIDALSSREIVVPGETFQVALRAYISDPTAAKFVEAQMLPSSDVKSVSVPRPVETAPVFRKDNPTAAAHFDVTADPKAAPTQPYWLEQPRKDDIFIWPDGDHQTKPFRDKPLNARFRFQIAGQLVEVNQPVEFRFADPARGEIRRELNIVPALSISLDRELIVAPVSNAPQRRNVVVTVSSNSVRPLRGTAALQVSGSPGITITSARAEFEINRVGESVSILFKITIAPNIDSSRRAIFATASVGGRVYDATMQTVAYPHIQTHRYYKTAAASVQPVDLKVKLSTVGYLPGSGDGLPEAIRQIGIEPRLLTANAILTEDLSSISTIVIGIRASEVVADFAGVNKRLLEYASNGGVVVFQYQRPGYAQLVPFPAKIGPRVVDENAPVKILQPGHAIFKLPNKITLADFEGWVQERNLYSFDSMDARYTPLLESHDAGEAANTGGLVIADVGKGKYIYCSYALFRQLPAGVPGAYRLLANLLGLGGTDAKKANPTTP